MNIDEKYLEIIEKCPFFSSKDGFSAKEILNALGAEIKVGLRTVVYLVTLST